MKPTPVAIVNIVVNGFLGILATYVIAAVACFQCKQRWRADTSQPLYRKRTKLRILWITAAILAWLHYWCAVVEFFLTSSPSKCYAFSILWLLTYALGILVTYIFLWARQHIVYTCPSMPFLRSKKISSLSWLTLLFLLFGAVMLFLAGSRLIFFSSCSARNEAAKRKLYAYILSITLLGITLIAQVQLLALFVIPIIALTKRNKENFNRTRSRRLSTVRRCLAAALACLVTDAAAAIVTITVEHSVGTLIYDVNLLVHTTSCLLSFKQWRRMLLPCCTTPQTNRTNTTTDSDDRLELDTGMCWVRFLLNMKRLVILK